MGRLIDADALIETLSKYKFGAISNDTEREYVKETVLNFVKEQPTAYDLEKVAAELEKAKEIIKEYEKYHYSVRLDKAIDIVKAGGINE